MIDRFGREIIVDGDKYTTAGIEVIADSPEQALKTFNAMAPEGWTEEGE